MFENSNAAYQTKLQTAKSAPALNRRSLGYTSGLAGPADGPGASGLKSGSSQHLKNALNLGKAMGARVNDLLRRKDPSSLGDIGVTEVNKNVGAVWTCMESDTQGITANRWPHKSGSIRQTDGCYSLLHILYYWLSSLKI